MNKKENLGYQKTHQRIQDCLLTLLEKKDIKNITVNELCSLVDINRSTFYAHYQDLYAVMETISETLETELVAAYQDLYVPGSNILSIDYFIIIITHIAENRVFYRAFLSESNENMLNHSMEMLRSEIILPMYKHIGLPEREGNYYFDFFKSGFLSVLHRWLDDDCPETPKEIAEIIIASLPAVPSAEWLEL